MLHPASKIGLAVILCGLLLLPNAMLGQKGRAPQVQDEAKLFSEKAVEEANAIIAKIKETHKKDLVIETKEEGSPKKDAEKTALERFDKLGLDGVYIIITKQPRHFEVINGKQTRERGLFTVADRDELVKILKSNLGKESDQALLKVANYTLETMNKRTTVKPAKPNPSPPSEFSQLVGEWVGPPVEVTLKSHGLDVIKERQAKGQVYLRFSEIRARAYLDLGYNVGTVEGVPLSVFRNYPFQLQQAGKERTIVIPYAKKDVVLTYELAEDVLKIKASGKLPIPDVAEPVDLSGEWKRLSASK